MPSDVIEGTSVLLRPTPSVALPTCGTCHYGRVVREGLAIVPNATECGGVPPTPVIMGQGPGGAAIGLMRPRMSKTEPACALHRPKLAIEP